MDLVLILFAFVVGFGLFMSAAYLLAKLIFPKLEDDEDFIAFTKSHKKYLPRITKHNPYSFK